MSDRSEFLTDYLNGDDTPEWIIREASGAVAAILLLFLYFIFAVLEFNLISIISLGGLATFALAILYFMQQRLLYKQTKIMRQQTNISELEHLPVIQISSINITNPSQQDSTVSRDALQLELSNKGRGTATNIRLRCDANVSGDDLSGELTDEFELQTDDGYIKFKPNNTPVTNNSTLQALEQGGVLESGDTDAFSGYVSFLRSEDDSDGGHWKGTSFSELLSLLKQSDVESINFQVSLIYSDALDRLHAERILSNRVTLSEGPEARCLLEAVSPRTGQGGKYVSENTIKDRIET